MKHNRHGIHDAAPVRRRDEGLPLGNGLIGLLIRGDGQPLNLSVNRSDLWGQSGNRSIVQVAP